MHEDINHIAPEGHPIHTLMTEHHRLLGFAEELVTKAGELKNYSTHDATSDVLESIKKLINLFKDSEKHYLREENVLFPYAEKRGITGPPQVMWMEHDAIRELKKKLFPLVDEAPKHPFEEFASRLDQLAKSLKEQLSNHFFKENNMLFPASLEALQGNDWEDVSQQFRDIGYCSFSPQIEETESESEIEQLAEEGEIQFETGAVSPHVLEAMLNTLPVEITFIDDKDTVRYFSLSKDMIFTRTRAILGNLVQNCHPQKSVHLVTRIVESFRSGARDVADFWIDMNDKKVYIRYFAVRDKTGKYLGCMEVAQDIAPIQKIEGQQRLLDWS